MSTAFSKRMQGVGTRLLTKYGSTVNLVRKGQKTWDPVLGEYVWGVGTTVPLKSVPVPVNAGLVNGTTIQAGDMVVKADYSVIPKMDDKVQFNDEQWSVVAIEKKMVNDDVVAYFIQVRK
ncbi:neck protein [Salmonella phage STP03]|uniref:Neck protein n=1 Tax=Salmonella phage STP03 TaxID=1914788 RepID=A0A1U9HZ28_9CAUD|nr:neck protein [Salmonella phage STP03]APM00271.1 neck protein [Salmonella phage STP03]